MDRASEVDERIAALLTQKNKVVAEMTPLVLEVERDGLFSLLGATSVTDYMGRRAGWDRSKTEKIVALARNLEDLPRLRATFAGGALPWTNAYLASVLATPETDAAWAEKSLTVTKRQLEAELARANGREVVEQVTLKLSPAELAAVDLAVTAVRSESPQKNLAFGEAVAEACKRVIEGGGAGSSKTRIVIHVCAGCHKATLEGKEGPVEISETELETLACDAEVVDIQEGKARLSRTIPPSVENFVRARDHGRCRVPGCRNRAHVHLHHEGGWLNVGHDPLSVYMICVGHHRALHKGQLIVRRLAPGRFGLFRLDGQPLGEIDLDRPMDDPATFPGEGAAGKGPAVEEIARESSIAVAFLRKLEFRATEARDLVTRAIGSTPPKAWTADELVRASLLLVEQRVPATAT
jgi:hypothetical protein